MRTVVFPGWFFVFHAMLSLLGSASFIRAANSVEALGESVIQNNCGHFVGVNLFGAYDDYRLSYCANDALMMADLFVNQIRVLPARQTVVNISYNSARPLSTEAEAARQRLIKAGAIVREEASTNEIYAQLSRLSRIPATAESFSVIYFSSHGAEFEHSPYLMGSDTHPDTLATYISLQKVEETMRAKNDGKRLILLDACRTKLAVKGIGRFDLSSFEREFRRTKGRMLVSACGPDQVSVEDPSAKLGVFTAAFLDALTGKFESDTELITLGDALAFVAREVPRRAGQVTRGTIAGASISTPWVRGDVEAQEIPLAVSSAARSKARVLDTRANALSARLAIWRRAHPAVFSESTFVAMRNDLASARLSRRQALLETLEPLVSAERDSATSLPDAVAAWRTWQGRLQTVVATRDTSQTSETKRFLLPYLVPAPAGQGRVLAEKLLRAWRGSPRCEIVLHRSPVPANDWERTLAEHKADGAIVVGILETRGDRNVTRGKVYGVRESPSVVTMALEVVVHVKEGAPFSKVYEARNVRLTRPSPGEQTDAALRGLMQDIASDNELREYLGLPLVSTGDLFDADR